MSSEYVPTGFPSDNAQQLPSQFRGEFNAIASAMAKYTSTQDAVGGNLWFGEDSDPAQSGPNQYRIALRGGAGEVDFTNGYAEGTMVWFRPKKNNTGGSGISVNGYVSREVLDTDGRVLSANAITSGNLTGVMYHDGRWRVIFREHESGYAPPNPATALSVDSEFSGASNDAFHTIYADLTNLNQFQQITFTIETDGGMRVGSVPRTAIREVADGVDLEAPQNRKYSINVFGGSTREDEGPYLWIAIQDGKLKAAYQGTASRSTITMVGQALPSYVQGNYNSGWFPLLKLFSATIDRQTRKFLSVDGWQGGSGPTPSPSHALITPSGYVPRIGDSYTEDLLTEYNAISTQPNYLLSLISFSPSDGGDNFTLTGDDYVMNSPIDPYSGGSSPTSNYFRVNQSGTNTPNNGDQRQFFLSYSDEADRRIVIPLAPPPYSHADFICTLQNATRYPIVVVPSVYSGGQVQRVMSSSPSVGYDIGRAFVVAPGDRREFRPSSSLLNATDGSDYLVEKWYASPGSTGLTQSVNDTITWPSVGAVPHIMNLTGAPALRNWSGIQRLIWNPVSYGGTASGRSQFPFIGHPDWRTVTIVNKTSQVLGVYAKRSDTDRKTVIGAQSSATIDFQY